MSNNIFKMPVTKLDLVIASLILGVILFFSISQITLSKPADGFVAYGTEVPKDISDDINKYGAGPYTHFHLVANPSMLIYTNTFSIDMPDFITYLSFVPQEGGIRVYPAYDKTNDPTKISYILAIDGGDDMNERLDANFILLNQDFNSANPFLITLAKDYSDYKPYFTGYHNMINCSDYTGSPYNTHGPSRYYAKEDLISFLRRNNVSIKSGTALTDYKDFKLQISGGSIDEVLKKEFVNYFSKEIPKEYCPDGDCEKGFTVLFRVIDSVGLVSAAHEIGKPCPPKCGTLSW